MGRLQGTLATLRLRPLTCAAWRVILGEGLPRPWWLFRPLKEAWRSFWEVMWLLVGKTSCPHTSHLPTWDGSGSFGVFRVFSAVAEFGEGACPCDCVGLYVYVWWGWGSVCTMQLCAPPSGCLAWVLVASPPKSGC